MKHAATEVLVGGSVGLFLGLLVGMSASPVVGIVVSGIVGILAALMGLATSGQDESAKVRKLPQLSSKVRMIAFGLTAAGGLCLGLWIRTHNLLSPSRADDVQAWVAAGWPMEEARALRVYSELGLVPAGSQASGKTAATSSVLYSDYRDQCRDLSPSRYKSHNEALNAWRLEKGVWAALADAINETQEGNRPRLLTSSWSTLCPE